MRFTAFDSDGNAIAQNVYFSVGGGFVVDEQEALQLTEEVPKLRVPYSFSSAAELLAHGETEHKRIPEMMRINELALRSPDEVRHGLLERWSVMNRSIERGMAAEGLLPGGLNVTQACQGTARVAACEAGREGPQSHRGDRLGNLYAIAVNEENAAGGRVVTAPTNGAAGTIPAVMRYYDRVPTRTPMKTAVAFLLTAAAIGGLCKRNASISGAEVGCQGEVGVACSMAAAGLAAALGGTQCPDRERRRDRHGASPRPDLRPDRRTGADPLHRAQRHGRDQGHQRRAPGAARRRHASRSPRQGHQDHVRNRRAT